MIYYPIQLLVAAGITDIIVVAGGNSAGDFLPLLGDGAQFGLAHLDYTYQERAGGIAEALGLTRQFADDASVCVILGDNVFEYSIRPAIDAFVGQGGGARILVTEVDEPQHYGVPVFEGERLVRIEEKPVHPRSKYAVTGCYLYDSAVFDIVASLRPSARDELEITDVNNEYVRRGTLKAELIQGYWADCGESFGSYMRAGNLVAERGASKPTASPATR